MQFTDEEYYQAATERMRQAREIHDSGRSYALAMYGSGLAVHALLLLSHRQATPATLWLPSQIDLFALGMAVILYCLIRS